jgi:hypothetical protein
LYCVQLHVPGENLVLVFRVSSCSSFFYHLTMILAYNQLINCQRTSMKEVNRWSNWKAALIMQSNAVPVYLFIQLIAKPINRSMTKHLTVVETGFYIYAGSSCGVNLTPLRNRCGASMTPQLAPQTACHMWSIEWVADALGAMLLNCSRCIAVSS